MSCRSSLIDLSARNVLLIRVQAELRGQEELVAICDRFWDECVSKSAGKLLQALKSVESMDEQLRDLYQGKCSTAMRQLQGIKNYESAAFFLRGLFELSARTLPSIFHRVEPARDKFDVASMAGGFVQLIDSCSRIQDNRWSLDDEVIHRAGLVAEFLLEGYGGKQRVRVPQVDANGSHSLLQLLALCDLYLSQEELLGGLWRRQGSSLMNELRAMQVELFRMLPNSSSLGLLSPDSACLLLCNFVEQNTGWAISCLMDYLELQKKMEFWEFSMILGMVARNAESHNFIWTQAVKFAKSRLLSMEQIQALCKLIDFSKLTMTASTKNEMVLRSLLSFRHEKLLERSCQYCDDINDG